MQIDEPDNEKFYLKGSVLGSSKSVVINATTFEEIAEAHSFYVDMILIEEKYDTVVENYYEFERELIEIAARHMLFNVTNEVFFSQTSLINRRLLNFLSAVRMYIDHTRKQVIGIFGRKSNLPELISEKMNAVKVENVGYLLLEQIRNFSQHAGYAVQDFSVGASSTKIGDRRLSFYDLRAKIVIDDIFNDPRVDRSLRDRASEITERDAKDLIRDGMDGLSEIHQYFRDCIDEHIPARKEILLSALWLFDNHEPKYSNESPILIKEQNTASVYHRYISKDTIARFDSYRSKNRQLRGLKNRRIIS